MPGTLLICCWGPGAGLPRAAGAPDARVLRLEAAGGPLEALRTAFRAHAGPVALVRAGTALPADWLVRLRQGLEADPTATAVTALDDAVPRLNPWPTLQEPPPAEAADWLLTNLSERAFFPQHALSPSLSLWREAPGVLASVQRWEALAQADTLRILTCDHLRAPSGPPAEPAPGPLDPLRERLAGVDAGGLPALAGHRRQSAGVVLHVTHGWGGGTARWIDDLAGGLRDRRHLVLIARGDETGHDCGRTLELRVGGADGLLARTWQLPRSIRATDRACPEYGAVLDAIIRQRGVTHLVVSSLIGQALEVLRTGLPTLVLFHDFYPAWPRLDVAFETPGPPWDRARLESLATTPDVLSALDADAWEALRPAYRAALRGPGLSFAAPSRSVIDNLRQLDGVFEELDIALVPHGHRPFRSPVTLPRPAPPARARWRLVVPGRLGRGKGRDLLLEALPRLSEQADLVLLGPGRNGHAFFGRPGVDIVLEYDRDRLPEVIDAIAPDAALLPSTVSETFSYTLSEMWAMGLPVLASRLGALGERVHDGEDGLLFEPTPDGLLDALRRLDRGLLQELRAGVARIELPTLADMAARYREILGCATPQPAPPVLAGPPHFALAPLAGRALELAQDLAASRRKVAEQEDELRRRGSWGFDLERRLAERTAWAQGLDAELGRARRRIEDLDGELEDRTRWARDLNASLEDRERQLAAAAAEREHLEAARMDLQASLDQARASRDELRRALAALEADYQTVITSRSWRITRPFRVLARLLRRVLAPRRTRRLLDTARRTRRSLAIRGVGGTIERVRRELRRPRPEPTPRATLELTEDYAPLAFSRPDAPRASIVIPVHNHYAHTYACLRSLLEARSDASFEVVVVDDASTDETAGQLAQAEGIVHLHNDENLGFVGACNRGAAAASGEFVVFLNNDTVVADRWLDALLETFAAHPGTGLVGARLVYPDGRLQEAGGIVFSDASGWNYGRFEDPDHPAFNHVRDVDYCSGAAIALPRALFDELGGFDTRYAPAYYEDTDLAFAVRERDLRVLYQPRAVVTHFEGITSGTDTSTGMKRYQVVNQEKFREKWAGALGRQPAPGSPVVRAREHGRPRRALIIDACTPEPDKDSGSLRMVNLMTLLRELGYQVSFLADNRAYVPGYSDALRDAGVEVWFHPWADGGEQFYRDFGDTLDVAVISRYYVAREHVEALRRHCPGARLLFDTVDLHFLRELRQAELEGDETLAAHARETRSQELGVARRTDVTLVVSPYEKAYLAREAPELEVAVLSNIHRVHGCRKPWGERRDLLFVGGYQHPPNIDAVKWFCSEILPLVRRELPEVRFHIVGSRATPEVRRLGAIDGVEYHGFVADLEPFMDGCRLALAPLRYGAGVKGKVNSSMSYGQPVVATTPAVEGMQVEDGREVLIADAPEAFARAVVRAYRDEALWNRLSAAGLDNVQRHFSFDAARRALAEVLGEDAPAPQSAAGA